jgi:hypothetical protein
LLADCLDISAVWSIDHEPDESCFGLDHSRLLAFADAATLARLRTSQYLHSPGVEFLVVVWRQTSAREAYYDESRRSGNDGAVMRVRRKAFLISHLGASGGALAAQSPGARAQKGV